MLSITLFAFNLPSCLSPIFIVGILRDGASRIPLDEFPKTKSDDFKKLENLFTGPTAVAFSEDAITSAKILTKFAKNNSNLKIIGGIMEDEPLSQKDVEKIATLPTLTEARGKIAGILTASAQKIVSILLAPGSKIAILAHAKSKKT